jgi:membrane protein
VISLAGIFFGRDAVQGRVYDQIKGLIGTQTAIQVQQIIQNIQHTNQGKIGSIIGFIILLLGASGVFSEIQDSLNAIWSVNPGPKKGWLWHISRKLLSFSLLIGMGFMLMVTLMVNALVDLLSENLKTHIPGQLYKLFYAINLLMIVIVISSLFTVIFKVLPNAIIRWKDAMIGSLFTSLLFLLGKFAIGFYLGNSRIGITYGTAASIIILMLWVYYSSIILYFGASFTRAYARNLGVPIRSR